MGGHTKNALTRKPKGKHIVLVGNKADVQCTLLRECLKYIGIDVTYEDTNLTEGLKQFGKQFVDGKGVEIPAASKILMEASSLIYTTEQSTRPLLEADKWIVSDNDMACVLTKASCLTNKEITQLQKNALEGMLTSYASIYKPDAFIYLDKSDMLVGNEYAEKLLGVPHVQMIYAYDNAKDTFKEIFMRLVNMDIIEVENPQEKFEKFIDFAKSSAQVERVQAQDSLIGSLVMELEDQKIF